MGHKSIIGLPRESVASTTAVILWCLVEHTIDSQGPWTRRRVRSIPDTYAPENCRLPSDKSGKPCWKRSARSRPRDTGRPKCVSGPGRVARPGWGSSSPTRPTLTGAVARCVAKAHLAVSGRCKWHLAFRPAFGQGDGKEHHTNIYLVPGRTKPSCPQANADMSAMWAVACQNCSGAGVSACHSSVAVVCWEAELLCPEQPHRRSPAGVSIGSFLLGLDDVCTAAKGLLQLP
ncbi:hypothetical protein LZ30DRAFT_33742 [Colletotrichum cereale]|nr:hypothetical protein LZ30DRAFT_33742 [Colletotrichum cereale]